jgi:uncharacterized protein (TIGR03437 family)
MRLFSILLALPAIASAQFTAGPGSPFPAGANPSAVVAGDFNGDGIQDLAIADFASEKVTVLLGTPTGGFSTPGSTVMVGSEPVSMAAFPCGGSTCLAIANQGDGSVTILAWNATSGAFAEVATGSPIMVQTAPVSVAAFVATAACGPGAVSGSAASFSPTVWLAVANSGSNSVSVLIGNGTAAFQEVPGSPITVKDPSSVAIGCLNGDNLPDVVVTNKAQSTVTVLLGNTAGGFTAPGETVSVLPQGVPQPPGPPAAYPVSVAIADFNMDGKMDLAIANEGTDNLTILLGDGQGKFAAAPGSSPIPVESRPFFVTVGNFNGDPIPDLAVANEGDNTVTVLLGNGAGGFAQAAYNPFTPDTGSPYSVGTSPVSLAVADFNGDGTMDLAVANEDSNTVSVLLNSTYVPVFVVSTATYALPPSPVAIGSIVSIFGSSLASAGTVATTQPLPFVLGDTGVAITYSTGGQEFLPLFYAGPTQINAMIPADAVAGEATVTVYTAAGMQYGSVMLSKVAPGLFSANGNGQGVAAAQWVSYPYQGVADVFQCTNGSGTCIPVPIDVSASSGKGEMVLYGTGIRNAVPPVMVSVGGVMLTADYAGAAPGSAGEDQVNVALPASLPGGLTQVTVLAGGMTSNAVTIYIE